MGESEESGSGGPMGDLQVSVMCGSYHKPYYGVRQQKETLEWNCKKKKKKGKY
jgi:hypothetical protein